ncbi:hypothetical protein C5N14_31075 [Micromonospora sp. MW-13]|nr:hypothetical protein C5N14_31075 [Micromonospora sp. MW-13]
MTAPAARRAVTPSAKRTTSRTWRTQYSGVRMSSAAASAPVRFDTTGSVGAANVSVSRTARNPASIGSISGLWKAWLTVSRRVRTPRSRHARSTSSRASAAPDTTTADGPLTAAMPTRSVSPARLAATSASGAATASMPPPAGSACISRPRAATRAHASARDSTPATWAAVISPIEWPPTRSGAIPNDSTSRNSATSTANRPAWVNTVWSSSSASAVPGSANSTGFSGCGSSGSSPAHTSSSTVANPGKYPYSSRPMPARCAPWPENSTARGPRSAAWPATTAPDGSPAASARSPATRSSRPVASTTARLSRADREVTDEKATSSGRRSGSAASHAAQRPACAASAAASRADTGTGTTGRSTAGAASAGAASTAGACSTMMCALVPETPNDDTAERRGRSTAGHGVVSVTSSTAPASQSTWGVGASTCRVGGTTPCRIASTILITPATPAAAWVCPRFDFTEPSSSGAESPRSCPYVASSACASIGSPSRVPVPCASTTSTPPAARPALASACWITRCWDGPLGALRPLDAPSWLTALPRTTARIGWPLRWASDSRSSSSTPTPSDQEVPSAAAANALHRPSSARPPCRENSTKAAGVHMAVTPATMARVHSRWRSAWPARCSATREDEQAVSMVTAGPSRPKV